MFTDRYSLSENWEKKFQIFTKQETDILTDSVYVHVLRLKHRSILHLMDKALEKLKSAESEDEERTIIQYQMSLNAAKKEIGELLGMVVVR
jgi:DNA primase